MFFSEANKKRNLDLHKNCQDLNNINSNVEYKIYRPNPFSTSLPMIMEELNEYPTLFFLDVFAVKGLILDDITYICNYLSKYKGELFLLFHNRTVARHAGFLEPKSEKESMLKAAKTYTEHLTRLLGEDSAQVWPAKWFELKNYPQEFERWALEYFKSQLLLKSNIAGVTSFEIKESYNDTRPQYSIVVCSNYPARAFGELLNDFIAEENRLLFCKESDNKLEPANQFLENKWNQLISLNSEHIKNRAIDILKKKYGFNSMSVNDAITCLILEISELGLLKRKEYKKVIDELYIGNKFKPIKLGRNNKLTLESRIKLV